jgi:hypothetical protein
MALPLRQLHQPIQLAHIDPVAFAAATDPRDLLAQARLELRRPPHIHGICDVRKFVEADNTVVFIPLCLCDVPGPEFVVGQGEDPADAHARASAWVCNWQDADEDIAAYILYIERSTEQRVLRQTERFTDARRRETALNTAVTR